MIDSAVTLLPQPDSPTMPSVRPASSVKLTPSTAANSPSSVAKCVRRSRTSSSAVIACRVRLEARDLLLDHRAVGDARGPRLARHAGEERLEALEALLVEAAQLGDRLGVVVDAQVEERIVLGRVDEERRRLLAALVAARGLARVERREQPLGERQRGVRLVRRGGLGDHLRAGEHVAGDRVAVARAMPAPVDARAAGVRRGAPSRVDHVELARLAAFVGADVSTRTTSAGGHAFGEQVETRAARSAD